MRSTGEAQPLAPEQWPVWMQNAPGFVGAWITPGNAQAEVLAERTDQRASTHRYYRFFYCELSDGRVFQARPSKDIGFGHHLNVRPPFLDDYKTT